MTALDESNETQGKPYTRKQMGDACEMLIAAELTLAGVPALKVPDNWPGYDVIAQPPGLNEPLRISVKSRTFKKGAAFVEYLETDTFDWLAIVLLNCPDHSRRIFLIPRAVADAKARKNKPTTKTAKERYWPIDQIADVFPEFEDNFSLAPEGDGSILTPCKR
ncbi:MAG: hypothetical protein FD139_1430 [Methylocystaceae bacterium]|nr:MAG: hypothetical protein FD148_2712 [Methylocystaceae bacterium]KAF0213057.1 MAG: hypothetical protein FD172_746 [Methylocystaceae bacterium]TXT45822.1 MAG: hypothetical protein FD139_1430 [Methylocystaceae bacterium]